MSKPVYVEITDYAGDTKTEIGGQTLAQATVAGSAIGAGLGTIVPGVGNVVGGFIGAVGGFLNDLLQGRPTTKDHMRELLGRGFGEALPGNVEMVGPPGKQVPIITGVEFDRSTIRAAIDKIGENVLGSLAPGSDAHTDLSRAFNGYVFHDSDKDGYRFILGFLEPDFTQQDQSNNNGSVQSDAGSSAIGLGLIGLIAALGK